MSPNSEPPEFSKSCPITPGLLVMYPQFKPADGSGRPDPDTRAQLLRWTKLHFKDLLGLRVAQDVQVQQDGTTLYPGAHLDTADPPIPNRITAQCRFNREWRNNLKIVPGLTLNPYIYISNLQHIGIAQSQAFNELSRALDLGNTRALNEGEEPVKKKGSVFGIVQMTLYKEVSVSLDKEQFEPKMGHSLGNFQAIEPARFNIPGCSTCLVVIKAPLQRADPRMAEFIQFLLARELWDDGEHDLYTGLYRYVETLKDIPQDRHPPLGNLMHPPFPAGVSSQGGAGSGQANPGHQHSISSIATPIHAPPVALKDPGQCSEETGRCLSTQSVSSASSGSVDVEGLRKFSEDFKVPYPLPEDLLPVLAKDPVKRYLIALDNMQMLNSSRLRAMEADNRAKHADNRAVEEIGRSEQVGEKAKHRPDHHLLLFLLMRNTPVDVDKWRGAIGAKVHKILAYYPATQPTRDADGFEWDLWDGELFMGKDVPLEF